MSSPVEQIKERLPILDVISGYIKVEKAGKNYKAKCPFHNEKTPSFFISPERNSYYCFGCGAKGDAFSFVESFEGVDFMGALKMLAIRAGVTLDPAKIGRPDPNARIYAAIEEAVTFFESNLVNAPVAKQYILDRGITESTIKAFSLGWAQGEWRTLYDHLTRKGFTPREIMLAGLAKQKMDEGGGAGSHPYDVFRERIMFPIFDASGRPVAFSGRILDKGDEHTPKYVNSPETPIFKKSEILYGFDKAKSSIRQYNFSILVEGQIDLVMTHQAGFTNTVASMGTAITTFHVDRLKRISNNVVIALDADDAGVASALKTAAIAMRAGMDVKLAALPEGKDPADLVREDKELWRAGVREAKHVIDFLLERIMAQESDTRKAKQRVTREVLPYVAMIENGIDQAHFISRIATAINVDDTVVRDEVRKIPFGEVKPLQGTDLRGLTSPEAPIIMTRHDRLVRLVAGILFWQEKEEKPDVDVKALRESFERVLGTTPETLYPEADRDGIAFEAETGYVDSSHIDKHVKEMFVFLEEHMLKESLTKCMSELTKAESEGRQAEALELLAKCKEITKRLNEVQKMEQS
jgi:DNA primase